jgi:hypothetical protein
LPQTKAYSAIRVIDPSYEVMRPRKPTAKTATSHEYQISWLGFDLYCVSRLFIFADKKRRRTRKQKHNHKIDETTLISMW